MQGLSLPGLVHRGQLARQRCPVRGWPASPAKARQSPCCPAAWKAPTTCGRRHGMILRMASGSMTNRGGRRLDEARVACQRVPTGRTDTVRRRSPAPFRGYASLFLHQPLSASTCGGGGGPATDLWRAARCAIRTGVAAGRPVCMYRMRTAAGCKGPEAKGRAAARSRCGHPRERIPRQAAPGGRSRQNAMSNATSPCTPTW